MFFYKKPILLCLSLLIYVFVFSQEKKSSSSAFLELIKTEKIDKAFKLMELKKESDFTEDKFLYTWGKIKLSLGNLKEYSFKCEELAENKAVQYYRVLFEKAEVVFKFHTNSKDEISGFFVIQNAPCDSKYLDPSYVNNQNYLEEKIIISDIKSVITKPASNAFKILCVLLPGSGPQDKDASIGSNKPFRDLALGLANKGITTIRFDKRIFNVKNKNYTIEDEYTSDVFTVVNQITEDKLYNEYKIFLIGHSLGGMVAPTIAKNNKNIKGTVLMGANFRPLEDLVFEQTKYLLSIDSKSSKEEKESHLNILTSKVSYLKDSLSINSETRKLPLNVPASYWISLKKYDLSNKKLRKKIKKPMLTLWGEKDYQVPKVDFDSYKTYFSVSKNEFKSYPELNHLFLKSDGSLSPKEYLNFNNVPEYVINDIVLWLKRIIEN